VLQASHPIFSILYAGTFVVSTDLLYIKCMREQISSSKEPNWLAHHCCQVARVLETLLGEAGVAQIRFEGWGPDARLQVPR
jgi:hypothetical protein